MKITDKDLAFLLFCLCVIASWFWPNEVKGQNQGNILKTGTTTTFSRSYFSGIDTVWTDPNIGKVTKDTIQVEVLCRHQSSNGVIARDWLQVDTKRMERTFSMQWVNASAPTIYQNGGWISHPFAMSEYKLVQITSRYLDNIEGCYQLMPIKDSDQ